MFGGALNRDAFLTCLCQQSRSGRGVDTRWVQQILGVSKSTAIAKMGEMEKGGDIVKTEHAWRSNAVKFWYYPTGKIWDAYHAKSYRAGYLKYMRAMMES